MGQVVLNGLYIYTAALPLLALAGFSERRTSAFSFSRGRPVQRERLSSFWPGSRRPLTRGLLTVSVDLAACFRRLRFGRL
ncbi:hypothetical protein GGR52DRAFT_267270 [Hypoxylon sp. FL1284]|nr:hypothetical protein GGR52DRAFT_267270 [Hypoxylon sp. FL1284]